MQSHTIPHLKHKKRKAFNGNQVFGRQRPARHQEYIAQILMGVAFDVVSVFLLFDGT
jgi:hypothetical protein